MWPKEFVLHVLNMRMEKAKSMSTCQYYTGRVAPEVNYSQNLFQSKQAGSV